MLPALQAIGTAIGAVNAVSTLQSWLSGSSTATPTVAGSATTTQQVSGASRPAAAAALDSAELQDRFLKLLVTQMKNQDPLNPLDNAQVTTQLAQISTVSGVDKLNTTLGNLSTSMLAAQSLQSAALIGHQVYTAGARLTLGANGAGGGVELQQPADRVTVAITDAAGNLVRRLELGAQQAGVVGFQWDGLNEAGQRATDGIYLFQVAALRGTEAVAAVPLAAGRISGVTFGADGLRLNVDGAGDASLGQIRRIF